MNVAVPVGVPLPGETGLTVAVNVTAWPAVDGLAEETTLVVVLGLFHGLRQGRRGAGREVAGRRCRPRDRIRADREGRNRESGHASAERSACRESVDPSMKVTVPVGVPLPGEFALTVAVNVTDCP